MKHRVSIITLWCILFVATGTSAYGIDTNANRTINTAQWHQLTTDKAFDYKNAKEPVNPPPRQISGPNPLSRFIMKLLELLGSNTGKVLLWGVMICIIVYVIYKIAGSRIFAGSGRKLATQKEAQEHEDINATDWDAQLQQAMKNNDLRLATRYSYMWLLQMLQQRGLIQYRQDKTNHEYYTELAETVYKQSFQQLSRQYEYTWYGHATPSAVAYDEFRLVFNKVKKQLAA